MASSYLTVNSGVAKRTGALICSIAVKTCATIEAGLGVTLVDVILAVAASESRQTETGEGVDAIHTGATVEARAEESQEIKCYKCFKKKNLDRSEGPILDVVGYLSVQSLVLTSQFMPLKPSGQVQV